MSRPIEVFNIFQKKTKTRVHLKVDEAMEGCTHREVGAGRQESVPQVRASSELQLGALREVAARERQGTLSRRA